MSRSTHGHGLRPGPSTTCRGCKVRFIIYEAYEAHTCPTYPPPRALSSALIDSGKPQPPRGGGFTPATFQECLVKHVIPRRGCLWCRDEANDTHWPHKEAGGGPIDEG